MVKGKGRLSQNWLIGTVWLAKGWAVHGDSLMWITEVKNCCFHTSGTATRGVIVLPGLGNNAADYEVCIWVAYVRLCVYNYLLLYRRIGCLEGTAFYRDLHHGCSWHVLNSMYVHIIHSLCHALLT
jgi:hypothetical protein